MTDDVVVIGAGPAGLALAQALRRCGVSVCVVAPSAPWRATYGVWRDDVATCDLGAPLETLTRGAWPIVRVVGKSEQRVRRPYLVFDNNALRDALSDTRSGGYSVVDAHVDHVRHDVNGSQVVLTNGDVRRAKIVFDATGRGDFLAHPGRPEERGRGAQTAVGYRLAASDASLVEPLGITPGVFTLMDWRTSAEQGVAGAGASAGDEVLPTFLYGAHFPDGSVLVEETSLFASPPVAPDVLSAALMRRISPEARAPLSGEREDVFIPMGDALPLRNTRVVGFGAAAGYVHPVTGYSVAVSLRSAPRVAAAVSSALSAGMMGQQLALAAWDAVWPASLVRTRAWHDVGLRVLQRLPASLIGEFFDVFFSLPERHWAAYLRVDSPPDHVRSAMFSVFRRASHPLRRQLMSVPGAVLQAFVAR